jgi:diguanylate cyclase (GGDEF)-like protein/PAS domain S-box-containing protein
MIDLDDFKPINELYGHDGGDEVLRQAAARLAACVRPQDVLARIGGDEFVAVIPDADTLTAVRVAERMHGSLTGENLVVGARSLRVSASFGIARGQGAICLAQADAALLKAKAEGQADIEVFGSEMDSVDEAGSVLRVTRFARELVFRLPLGVVVTNLERRILAASKGYEKLSGFETDSLHGQKPHQIVGTEVTDDSILTDVAHTLGANGMWQGEFVDRRPGGEIWWAECALAPIEVRGHALGYIGVVQDATPWHMREAQMLVEAIALLSEDHDPTIRPHLNRTGRYMHIAVGAWHGTFGRQNLPYNPEQYALASMLHDAGKLSVPPSILTKPGPLTPAERLIVNRHSDAGAQLLTRLTRERQGPRSEYIRIFLSLASEFALHHHECVDGSGYPCGLVGHEIPLAVRIFSAVDVYDALQAVRPYKAAWPEDEAFEYLRAHAGTIFDVDVVRLVGEQRCRPDWHAVRTSPGAEMR